MAKKNIWKLKTLKPDAAIIRVILSLRTAAFLVIPVAGLILFGAAYAARWVARNIVDAGLARRCEVQVAYAIGVAEPVSVLVDTFGTGALPASRPLRARSTT